MHLGSLLPSARAALRRLAEDRGALIWGVVVVVAYVAGTLAVAHVRGGHEDRAMEVAVAISHGTLSLAVPPGTNDTATVAGLTYQVISPLPIAPYLLFVPIPSLWAASRWLIGCALGIIAAWLMLPFARRYAGPGPAAYWLATLGAFGTLLFDQAIQGDFYYLAQVEAMLLTLVALTEFAGHRRPWVLGTALGLASLARPTLLLAAIPFGFAIAVGSRWRPRSLAGFALPIGLCLAVTGLYNAARFGSPLETGYGISTLTNPGLARARVAGMFSIRHLPGDLAALLTQGFGFRARFPYFVPDPYGHSILLTSPALLAAVGAGPRRHGVPVLWAATCLATIPLLLYYGGGGWQTYGFRYFLDAVPFLLALVGTAMRDRLGALEKLLIALSVAFVVYGLVWIVFG